MADDIKVELGSPVGHRLPSQHLRNLGLCSRQRTSTEGEPPLPRWKTRSYGQVIFDHDGRHIRSVRRKIRTYKAFQTC